MNFLADISSHATTQMQRQSVSTLCTVDKAYLDKLADMVSLMSLSVKLPATHTLSNGIWFVIYAHCAGAIHSPCREQWGITDRDRHNQLAYKRTTCTH